MNTNIPMGFQPTNVLAMMDAGTQAGARMGEVQQRGRLLNAYREHGAGVLSGDPNAMNALAAIDLPQAMDFRGQNQAYRINEETLQMRRAAGAREAQRFAAEMDAAEVAQTREMIGRGLATAIPALRSGDMDTVNQIFRAAGLPAAETPQQAAEVIATYEGAMEFFDSSQEVLGRVNAPAPTDDIREYEFARQNGYEGTFEQWMTRNRQPEMGLMVSPDGSITYGPGIGGQQIPLDPTADEQVSPVATPIENPQQVFGLTATARSVANSLADTLGIDVPFGEQAEAAAIVRLTEDALLQDIAEGYDRPPLELLRSIRTNIPQAESLRWGPTAARNSYNAIRQDFLSQLAVEEQQRARTRDPEERRDLNRRISALNNSIARIDSILGGLEGGLEGGGGVTPEQQSLIDRWAN
jgi:hypothetical protein